MYFCASEHEEQRAGSWGDVSPVPGHEEGVSAGGLAMSRAG